MSKITSEHLARQAVVGRHLDDDLGRDRERLRRHRVDIFQRHRQRVREPVRGAHADSD